MTEAAEEPATDSVFDFLYYDRRRVGALLSQMDPDGHLQQATRQDRSATGTSGSIQGKASGSVLVAKGSVDGSIGAQATSEETFVRVYDPIWANARTFLDLVDERQLLQRGLESAAVGKLVLVSGRLVVADLGLMKQLWPLKGIKKLAQGGMQEARNRQARRQAEALTRQPSGRTSNPPYDAAQDPEFVFELVAAMPHLIEVTIANKREIVWGTVQSDGLATQTAELLVKHGVEVPGTWSMVAVLDAQPDYLAGIPEMLNPSSPPPTSQLGQVVRSLGPAVRSFLGRPPDAWGATPLLIFRQVG